MEGAGASAGGQLQGPGVRKGQGPVFCRVQKRQQLGFWLRAALQPFCWARGAGWLCSPSFPFHSFFQLFAQSSKQGSRLLPGPFFL